MSIADKLNTLILIKTDIKASLLNKGAEVTDNMNSWASAIDNIQTGVEIIKNIAQDEYLGSNGIYYEKVYYSITLPDGSISSGYYKGNLLLTEYVQTETHIKYEGAWYYKNLCYVILPNGNSVKTNYMVVGAADPEYNDSLPPGYYLCNYILNINDSYIIHDYLCNPNITEIKFDCKFNKLDSNFRIIFSLGSDAFKAYSNRNGVNYGARVISQYNDTLGTVDLSSIYTFHYLKTNSTNYILNVYKDGVLDASYNGTYNKETDTQLYLFRSSSSINVWGNYFLGNIYNFVIKEESEVVNLIPCKNSEGIVGMYDVILDKFYSSPTSTQFVCDE